MSIEIKGGWKKGFAYDVHTLDSVYLGPDQFGHAQFDTTYSEMGGYLKKLKYRNDKSVIPAMIALLDKFKGIEKFDYIIPIPPTDKNRKFQPVTELAVALGNRHGVQVLTDLLEKKAGGEQLKNVDDPDKRIELLKELIAILGKHDIMGKTILLVDDLYRSGATLNVATDTLKEAGAESVSVLTMTKTRRAR